MPSILLQLPWGLLGLLSLPIVVVIYLYYDRHRPRRITGLFLWDAPIATELAGRRLEPPHRSRSLFLDLLALLLLSLALASPALTSSPDGHLVIILDGSLSMRASHLPETVRAQALEVLFSDTAPTKAAVIFADQAPSVKIIASRSSQAVADTLRGYDPFAPSDSLEEAVALARELVLGPMDIHVFSDHSPALSAPPGSRLQIHVLPAQGENPALLEALRWRSPPLDTELLSVVVGHSGKRPSSFKLTVKTEGTVLDEQLISLEPEKQRAFRWPVAENTSPITVQLTADEDALKEDSFAFLLPAPRSTLTARIALAAPPAGAALERALLAAGVTILPPAPSSGTSQAPTPSPATSATPVPAPITAPFAGHPDEALLITDQWSAEGAQCTLRFHLPSTKALTLLGPFVVDGARAPTRDLELSGVFWTADPDFKGRPGSTPLISVQDTVLLAAAGESDFELNLDLGRSNLARHPAWPVFFANLSRYCRERLPGLRRTNYTPGELLRFVPFEDRGLNPDTLVGDQAEQPLEPLLSSARLPLHPGSYTLRNGRHSLATVQVNALAPKESDLSRLAEVPTTTVLSSQDLEDIRREAHSFAWVFALAGLLTLLLNWGLERSNFTSSEPRRLLAQEENERK